MRNIEKNKFEKLNFNLKKEIFSFIHPKDVINKLLLISKEFCFAVKHIKWFKIIREDFDFLINNSSCELCKMQDIKQLFSQIGESEENASLICNYLFLRKIRDKLTLSINNKDFGINEKNTAFLKDIISYNRSIQNLWLTDISLCRNVNNMLYMKIALQMNNTIKKLKLDSNNLGENEINILYLSEALKTNNSIQNLGLYNNNLGANEKNLYYLKEALIRNNSIKTLDLQTNNLGINEINMLSLKEALLNNNSIEALYLYNNNLGRNVTNIIYLKEALEKTNNSILQLGIANNNLGEDEYKILKQFKNISIYYSIINADFI